MTERRAELTVVVVGCSGEGAWHRFGCELPSIFPLFSSTPRPELRASASLAQSRQTSQRKVRSTEYRENKFSAVTWQPKVWGNGVGEGVVSKRKK